MRRLTAAYPSENRGFMLKIGLTGSTGSGKGYVSDIFVRSEIPCLDTDAVCRDVYKKGEACYDDLVAFFGDVILSDDGEIDRKKLFDTAFPDKDKYEKLNSIAFFHIMKKTQKWLEEKEAEGEKIAVIDAPMLFESGFDKLCDKVISVTADRPTQIYRVMKRDGISEEVALSRLAKQKSNIYYESKSDYVLDNSVTNEENIWTDTRRLIGVLKRISQDKK